MESPFRHAEQIFYGFFRLSMPRNLAVILHPQDERSSIGVGKSSNVLGHEIARLSAIKNVGFILTLGTIPQRLEFDELPFFAREQNSQLIFCKQYMLFYAHASISTSLTSNSSLNLLRAHSVFEFDIERGEVCFAVSMLLLPNKYLKWLTSCLVLH